MDVLRDLLAQHKITQAQLADMIGVTRGSVSAWINEGTEPSASNVFAIEDALNLPAGYLSRHFGYLPLRSQVVPTTPEEIVKLFPKLDDRGRRVMLQVYDTLTSD